MKTLSTEEIKILSALGDDSSLAVKDLANLLKLPQDEVSRIKKSLEDDGIILKYRAIINWEKIESTTVTAVIQVNVTPIKGFGYDEVAKVISDFSEVNTCLLFSGSFDLLVEVEGSSLKEVAFFVADKLAIIDGVEHTRTNFLLKRYKQSGDVLLARKTHRLPISV